jgi:DNA polymerase zeta
MIFVKPAVRKSLLSKMLAEILDTRVMIKHAMKGARGNKVRRLQYTVTRGAMNPRKS